VPAGDPGHGDGRETEQNGGGVEGISTPCSPWTEIACGGDSAASGGDRLWWLVVVVVLGGLGGREVRLGGARRGGEMRRPFYRRGEVGSGKKNLPGDLRWGGRGVAGFGSNPAWTSAGSVRCGAVGCDASCRRAGRGRGGGGDDTALWWR
jgi:hypothetical protein